MSSSRVVQQHQNTASRMSHLPDKAESRILERKNIEKRLEGLHISEYQKISKNLQRQNEKLREEVSVLDEKVKRLIESRKFENIHKNPQIEKQIVKVKREMEAQYGVMSELKERVNRENQLIVVEEAKTQLIDKKNEIRAIEAQIAELSSERGAIQSQFRENELDFQQYCPNRDYREQQEKLHLENKELRKRVHATSVAIKEGEVAAKGALTKIYELRKEDHTHSSLSKRNRIKSLSVLHKPDSPHRCGDQKGSRKNLTNSLSTNSQQLKRLENEVQQLKKQKLDVQNEMTVERSVKESAKNRLQKQIRDLLDHHKDLFRRRVRELTELNYLEKKEEEIRERKNQKKVSGQQGASSKPIDRAMQTETVIHKKYRREWIGRSEGIEFDDSDILQYKDSVLIRSMTVYRTVDHIVFIRFGYEYEKRRKVETRLPFDRETLKKVEAKRVASKQNGHLVNLIVSVTKGIVTRVESRWSDGDSSVQGWEGEESSKFKFDVADTQRPICFFGSVVPHPKGFYALESLGCEVFEPEDGESPIP